MTETDRLMVKIYNIEYADVYVAKGKSYRWINHLDYLANDGSEFDTRMGWNFYIVGTGNSVFRGTFSIKAWIDHGTGQPKYVPPTVVAVAPTPTPTP